MSVLAAYIAALCEHNLSPGERGVVPLLAVSKKQAGVAFSYLAAIFAKPPFDKLKIREIAEQHLPVEWDRRAHDARQLSHDPRRHGHRRPRR